MFVYPIEKHAPSRELPLIASKTVFSHLKFQPELDFLLWAANYKNVMVVVQESVVGCGQRLVISKRCNQTCLKKVPAADLQGIGFCQSLSGPRSARALNGMFLGSYKFNTSQNRAGFPYCSPEHRRL